MIVVVSLWNPYFKSYQYIIWRLTYFSFMIFLIFYNCVYKMILHFLLMIFCTICLKLVWKQWFRFLINWSFHLFTPLHSLGALLTLEAYHFTILFVGVRSLLSWNQNCAFTWYQSWLILILICNFIQIVWPLPFKSLHVYW